MKKGWFWKYILTLLISSAIAVLVWSLMPKPIYDNDGELLAEGYPVWLPILIVPLALSGLAIWRKIKNYVINCLERVSTGNQFYNVLFKTILIIAGIVLLPFMLIAGVLLVVLQFIRELSAARADKQAQSTFATE